jgi:hypothetical protein
MKCPDCGGKLGVYRTYQRTDTTRHYCECSECGSRHITQTHYVGRIDEKKPTVAAALLRWKVSESKARALAASQPAGVIKEYCDNLPQMVQAYEATGKPVRDWAGFLVFAIESRLPMVPPNGERSNHASHSTDNGNGNHPPPGFTAEQWHILTS